MTSIVYLHGFASSPGSQKAQTVQRQFAALGVPVFIPDLNVPSFEELTLTAMIDAAARAIAACPPGPVCLIGSSMGGAVALHTVDRRGQAEAARVEKLLLLAPGLDFRANRLQQLGEEGLARWRASGWLEVYHYGTGTMRRVHYGLIEDLERYDSDAVHLNRPILIIHGLRDDVVSPRSSIRYAIGRPNVSLKLVPSDHQLLDQTDVIFDDAVRFFGLAAASR